MGIFRRGLRLVGDIFTLSQIWPLIFGLFAVTGVWHQLYVASVAWWVFAPAGVASLLAVALGLNLALPWVRDLWLGRLRVGVDNFIAYVPLKRDRVFLSVVVHGCQITNREDEPVVLDAALECQLVEGWGPERRRIAVLTPVDPLRGVGAPSPVEVDVKRNLEASFEFRISPLDQILKGMPDNIDFDATHLLTFADRVSGKTKQVALEIYRWRDEEGKA